MKKFIIMFIVSILVFALIIGQCNDDVSNLVDVEETYVDDEKADGKEPYFLSGEEIKEKGLSIDVDVNSVEIPIVKECIQNQILKRKAFTVSYSRQTKCPNWVAWRLTADHTDGDVKRFGGYFEDEEVPEPRATNEDYRGSGWSKGHMCPAGDNKWDEVAMRESNLLTNICPQDKSLNSGLWNRIEMDCRKWAQKYGSVYIVCGPLLYNKEHETVGENKVVVPEAFFKVILCMQGEPKAIGFVVKNNAGTKKKNQYVNTIDEVERLTGYDFFPLLPDSIEDKVEAYSNLDDWR